MNVPNVTCNKRPWVLVCDRFDKDNKKQRQRYLNGRNQLHVHVVFDQVKYIQY